MGGQAATEREAAGHLPLIRAPGFVGRERELAVLARALASPPAVVFIEGEAGIGKSRLVQEFLLSPDARDQKALVAVCPPLHEPFMLGPVVDALRQAGGQVTGLRLSALAGALRPLFPEWADSLPSALEPLEDASAARHRLLSALAELLGCLGVTVLVVEDSHWADEVTLEFLLLLAARQPRPLSLLVTCRPEDVPAGSLLRRLSSRLPTGTTSVRIALGPLEVADTAALVSSMLDGEQVSGAFAAFLHQQAEGIPLAVEESVRLLADRGDVFRHEGSWVRRHLPDITVPPTVADAVLERTGRLPPDAQAVLRAVAVLADPADEATVRAVAGLAAEQARAGLSEALGCGLLSVDGRGLVSFRHVLAARAMSEAIPAPDRRLLHLRAGEALQGLVRTSAAQLARHFRGAGDTGRWCRYAEQAADLALAAGDEATAAALLHDLLAHADLSPRCVVRLAEKIPFASFTGPARFRDLVQTLRSILERGIPDPGIAAEVRAQLGRVLLQMEEFEQGHAELERAIPQLGHRPFQAAHAMTLLGWGQGTTWTASMHLRWLQRAAGAAAPLAPSQRLWLRLNRVAALLTLGEQSGWAEAAGIPGDASTPQDRQQIARGQLNIGDQAMRWGRYAAAGQFLAGALDLAESHHYLRLRDIILATKVHLDWFTGAWDGLAERAAALSGDEDVLPVTRLEAVLVLGLLSAATGARAKAEFHLERVLAETRQRALEYYVESAAALAKLRLDQGRVDDALQVTDEPIRIVAHKGTWIWAADLAPARTAALLAGGGEGEAAELVAAFARGLRGRDAPAPRAALTVCRAALAKSRGEQARAAALFARAAAAWKALPRPYDALLARERQARCLLAGGQSDVGLSLLKEVLQGLSGLGARADAQRVLSTLQSHGVDAKRPWWGGRSYGDELSPRELDVARLLIGGATNQEIARALCLSPKTVARHIDAAMRKVKVRSRTALAVKLVETGLITDVVRPSGRAAGRTPSGQV